MKPEVGVGVVVVKNGKILFGRRKSSHGHGTWSIPGGHLEFGETFEQCAIREVFEETGLKVANVRVIDVTNDIFQEDNKHYVSIISCADYISGQATIVEPDKCDALEWFAFDNLPDPLFKPVDTFLKNYHNKPQELQVLFG